MPHNENEEKLGMFSLTTNTIYNLSMFEDVE